MTRLAHWRAVWPLAATLALAGCGGGPAAEGENEAALEPVAGGTCVVGLFSDYDSLNEFVSTDANATDVMENLLYMPLLRWNADIELEGRLAKSWEFSDDGRDVTMELRDDIRWHDGVPTTADDVAFSFERFRDPALGYPDQGALRYLESVEVLGLHRVRFHFTQPYADQLAHLRKVIMPKHLLEGTPSAEMESAPFNRNPVGNGPFKFVRWRQQQEVVLEANEDFPDGRPRLDRIVIRTIPDQTAIETALRSGQVDVVDRLRYETIDSFRRDSAFQVLGYEQRGYQFVGWNLRDPLFADERVRLAMTLAINRQRILDALVFGEGKVTANPVMSLSPFYADDIDPHPYAPDSAKALLAEVGWSDTNGDGVLDKDGKPFEFTLVTNLGNQLREDTLVMIQDDLKRVGVTVVPEVREWSIFLDEVTHKRFQAFHMAWQTDFIVNPYDTFHSDAIEGKYNICSYSNPRVDALIDEGLLQRTREAAMPIWHEYQEILHREQPYTILFELRYSVGASKRIRGMEIDARGTFVNAEEWWIALKDRKYAS